MDENGKLINCFWSRQGKGLGGGVCGVDFEVFVIRKSSLTFPNGLFVMFKAN